MKRVTPEEVLAAYLKTQVKPIRNEFLLSDDTNEEDLGKSSDEYDEDAPKVPLYVEGQPYPAAACGLGVVCIERSATKEWHDHYAGQIDSDMVQAYLDLDTAYVEGFTMGFDSPRDTFTSKAHVALDPELSRHEDGSLPEWFDKENERRATWRQGFEDGKAATLLVDEQIGFNTRIPTLIPNERSPFDLGTDDED